MKIIYENTVREHGELIGEFGDEMLIFFGDNAPDELRDYCYIIDIKETNGDIKKGYYFQVNEKKAKILAVGSEAQKNLVNLGHLTINLSGNVDDLLPGAIVCENTEIEPIKDGTIIKIVEE